MSKLFSPLKLRGVEFKNRIFVSPMCQYSCENGWQPIAPSPVAFDKGCPAPREMTEADMERVAAEFAAAAERSLAAGFKVLELHMAHGYLMHRLFQRWNRSRCPDSRRPRLSGGLFSGDPQSRRD